MDERRAQLLELGLELFSRRGPDDVQIDEIAQAAGISKGLLYHYFGSKRAYYVASVRLAARQLVEHTDAVASEAPDDVPLAGLRAGLDAYLDHVRARATGYAVLVTSGTADPEVKAIVEGVRQTFIDRFLEQLGLREPPPLLRTAVRAWIAFVETASLDWLEHQHADRAAVRELLVHAAVGALRGAGLPLPEALSEAP